MRLYLRTIAFLFFSAAIIFASVEMSKPIVKPDVVFQEKNGFVAVEAEFFYKQTQNEIRQWYITSMDAFKTELKDADDPHILGASNNAYIEVLPDTRTTPTESLINQVNFSEEPGRLAVVHYKINFTNAGRYYVWVRAYSTGAEDNSIHVGIDGTWPESGKRMQWCDGKDNWRWESKQRTEAQHCGEPFKIFLDVAKPGLHEIQFSMREDGFEFDSWILTKDKNYVPKADERLTMNLKSGTLPKPFTAAEKNPIVDLNKQSYANILKYSAKDLQLIQAKDFSTDKTNFYVDNNWLAIDPANYKEANTSVSFPFASGMYDVVFLGVGESDGKSEFTVLVNEKQIGSFSSPLSKGQFEEGPAFNQLWENITINKGDKITVTAKVGSNDGKEFSRGRWGGIAFTPMGEGKNLLSDVKEILKKGNEKQILKVPELVFSNPIERFENGNGTVAITGELKEWHKVTLTLDGPFAHELDIDPNPFKDYRMTVKFEHESGKYVYEVPGYFAADGNAAETSADRGAKWRANFSPDKEGEWKYSISFIQGPNAAVQFVNSAKPVLPYNGITGKIFISKTDKSGRDLRGKGRLEYVGKHHLQFAGTKEYLYKVGSDAPETFLAYNQFDATYTVKVPLKSYEPHINDWKDGDPTWQNGKGKGIIGAVNYLSGKGMNAFSFLTYNAGGDGDNVWPFVTRNAKFHYDCSKLDQWQIVFDHAQTKGMYLHFKTQETENDDYERGKNFKGIVPEALDAGDTRVERMIYYRELIARFSYLLALNWNLGEENTQTTEQEKAMAEYFHKNDPFKHHIVLHTFPGQQEKVYTPLLGENSFLTGVSLQNEWDEVHHKTLEWVTESAKAGKPWVVANDEQGSAAEGVPPDPGYKGYKGTEISYDINDVRKQVLWANLMAGGAGVEYYFGYKLLENDLLCEDYRSRDKSWDFGRIAIQFLKDQKIPFWEMKNKNELTGNSKNEKEKFCLAKENEIYLVYLAYTSTSNLDLTNAPGEYEIKWFNPREGGNLLDGSSKSITGGKVVEIGTAPADSNMDWLVILRKK